MVQRVLIAAFLAVIPAAASPLDATPQTRLDADLRCLLGAYALPSERSVIITGDSGAPRGLTYTLSNGRFGALTEQAARSFSADGMTFKFGACETGELTLTEGAAAETAVKTALVEKDTTFASEGIDLHGKLVLPADGCAQSMAVWIEGSNNNPSTDDTVWQYELARRCVAVFVYDKRGTGLSGGEQTSDFYVRARDTVAAVHEARRLAPHIKKIGVIGGSQGGWVAPLTATLIDLDFVIPAFALADGPIAQDKALVEQQVRQAGFDEKAVAEARELTAITERIVRSNMAEGFDDLDAFKAAHAEASWTKAIQPRSYTGLFLQFSTAELKAIGTAAAQGLDFAYEPRPVIEQIMVPQLWLLGGKDQQAPNAATQAILRQIQETKPDLSVVVFPNADHGLVEPSGAGDGGGMTYAPQLFDVAADWIKAQKRPAPGQFIVMP